jgi:hypothetical protein
LEPVLELTTKLGHPKNPQKSEKIKSIGIQIRTIMAQKNRTTFHSILDLLDQSNQLVELLIILFLTDGKYYYFFDVFAASE